MVGSSPNREESVGSQCQDHYLNLERRRDHEVSVYTTQTNRSQSQSGSHVSHEENARSMQLEIDRLWRRLRHDCRRRTPSGFDPSSNDERDDSYRPKSRTPPSESFLCDEDHLYKCKNRSPSCKGLVNDAMNRALNQISKSPFTCRIEGGKLQFLHAVL